MTVGGWYGSSSFVGAGFVPCDEVVLFAEAASDAGAIDGFEFGCGEVGGEVGEHAEGDEGVVAAEEDFYHGGDECAVEVDSCFEACIVEEVCDGCVGVWDEGVAGVFEDGVGAIL